MSRSIGIVGAGIVGLATGWFLQELGAEVTVLDRADVGRGASYANAGWVSPALVTPLPEPSVLRYGFKSLLRRDAPFRIPLRSALQAAPFLARFASNCLATRWERGLIAFQPLCELALPAYAALTAGGVVSTPVEAPLLAAFERKSGFEALRHELQLVEAHGMYVSVTELGAAGLSRDVPLLSSRARYGLRIERQHYIDPAAFVSSLADSFVARGGRLIPASRVEDVEASDTYVRVRGVREDWDFGQVVLAHGAWLPRIGSKFGIRLPIVAGRGYSCRVPSSMPLGHPLYLPEQRVACTPVTGGIRLAGTMEIAEADAPPTGVASTLSSTPPPSSYVTAYSTSARQITGSGPDRSLPMGFRSSGSRPTSECSPPAVTVCGG